ncbi:hypothetical protein E2C01_028658 [Portunus trituberculatus]|uniref:Uncharacterized protein n=1 Tax=Portunus trituberculatus TaxID=210409 RepID=A0A5B7EQ23_PORTR|nr:hypothetical protein [Portunus trituberculatus]
MGVAEGGANDEWDAGREECFLVTTCTSHHHGHDHCDASSSSLAASQPLTTTHSRLPHRHQAPLSCTITYHYQCSGRFAITRYKAKETKYVYYLHHKKTNQQVEMSGKSVTFSCHDVHKNTRQEGSCKRPPGLYEAVPVCLIYLIPYIFPIHEFI